MHPPNVSCNVRRGAVNGGADRWCWWGQSVRIQATCSAKVAKCLKVVKRLDDAYEHMIKAGRTRRACWLIRLDPGIDARCSSIVESGSKSRRGRNDPGAILARRMFLIKASPTRGTRGHQGVVSGCGCGQPCVEEINLSLIARDDLAIAGNLDFGVPSRLKSNVPSGCARIRFPAHFRRRPATPPRACRIGGWRNQQDRAHRYQRVVDRPVSWKTKTEIWAVPMVGVALTTTFTFVTPFSTSLPPSE